MKIPTLSTIKSKTVAMVVVAPAFALAACGTTTSPGQNLGIAVGAGAAAKQVAENAGVDDSTSSLVGLGVAIFTASTLNRGTQRQAEEDAAAGECVFTSEAVQGTRGRANEERRVCSSTQRGYRSGPL